MPRTKKVNLRKLRIAIDLLNHLRNEETEKILLYICAHPGCIQDDVVWATEICQPNVSKRISPLVTAGIITEKVVHPRTHYDIDLDVLETKLEIVKNLITYKYSDRYATVRKSYAGAN